MSKEILRNLPSVDELLKKVELGQLIEKYGRTSTVQIVRDALQNIRTQILAGEYSGTFLFQDVLLRILEIAAAKEKNNLRKVINATGIVLHTNLGRAVLSESAKQAVEEIAGGYSNLELDLSSGERGSRYDHVIELLKDITKCEDALVVNNNAAAVLLALNTLAFKKEAIISRGQLVEIGGSFRVPEVMEASQGKLVEVGTTNKTYLSDYERTITENTAVFLKVHTSNYRVVGFTHEVETEELVALGREKGIAVLEDLGSGLLVDLEPYKITDEPTVQAVVSAGVDVVTFSGDKLLGGPQAGIIVGKKKFIKEMKKNPLTRALRIDKLTVAALEATLREYTNIEAVRTNNPTLHMLTMPKEEIYEKAMELAGTLREVFSKHKYLDRISLKVEEGFSQAGGGSLPTTDIPTYVVLIAFKDLSVDYIAKQLRLGSPSVLVRIAHDNLILDPRTIAKEEFKEIEIAFERALF